MSEAVNKCWWGNVYIIFNLMKKKEVSQNRKQFITPSRQHSSADLGPGNLLPHFKLRLARFPTNFGIKLISTQKFALVEWATDRQFRRPLASWWGWGMGARRKNSSRARDVSFPNEAHTSCSNGLSQPRPGPHTPHCLLEQFVFVLTWPVEHPRAAAVKQIQQTNYINTEGKIFFSIEALLFIWYSGP